MFFNVVIAYTLSFPGPDGLLAGCRIYLHLNMTIYYDLSTNQQNL